MGIYMSLEEKHCCNDFRMSVIQQGIRKTSGLETQLGKWKCDVYMDHQRGDKLYPTMFNEKGEPQLYQYEDRRPLIMKYCPFCGHRN